MIKILTAFVFLVSAQSLRAYEKTQGVLKKSFYINSQDRQYELLIPSEKKSEKKRPLVVLLHGCLQNPEKILKVSQMDQYVEDHGFYLLAPFVTQYNDFRSKNCWAFWDPMQTTAGVGESQDLIRLTQKILQDYPVQDTRVFIVGLSSGAGMASVLAVQNPQLFAGLAQVAGPSYKETALSVTHSCESESVYKSASQLYLEMKLSMKNLNPPKTLIAHSHNDCVVQKMVAQENAKAWSEIFQVAQVKEQKKNVNGLVTMYRDHYNMTDQLKLKEIWVEDVDHGWFGEGSGDYGDPRGPKLSQEILKFFEIW